MLFRKPTQKQIDYLRSLADKIDGAGGDAEAYYEVLKDSHSTMKEISDCIKSAKADWKEYRDAGREGY